MATPQKCSPEIMDTLHKIFQEEMAGIIRYMHYSFMIMGYNRIPIQKWFRNQASEGMAHSVIIGEKITAYGGHPPVISSRIEDTGQHNVRELLQESMEFEQINLDHYKRLVQLATDAGDIALEELAREKVREETEHVDEVIKMLREI